MKQYFYRLPGMVYASEIYAKSIKEVKDALRNELRVKRLPKGTEIWAH